MSPLEKTKDITQQPKGNLFKQNLKKSHKNKSLTESTTELNQSLKLVMRKNKYHNWRKKTNFLNES